MAIVNFIPQIWNASMLENFHERSLAAGIANRTYEGDVRSGNTVKITGVVDVEVKNYKTGVSGARTTAADAVTDVTQSLLIDQEKNFDFYIDDIDRVQAAGGLDAYTRSAGQGLATDADKFLWATAANAATTTTVAALADTIGQQSNPGDAAHQVIRDLRKAMQKLYVPQESRFLVVNAEFEAFLLDASSKLTSVDVSGSPEGLRNATLGRYLGFTVITTENLPVTAVPYALALHGPSLGFASQIDKTEAMRAQDKFADRLRGLHVYGGKLITRPDGTVPAVAYDETGAV